jgi:hypothetical protein
MPYVKLDTKILDSSLWIEPTSRTIFITALLMARPLDLPDATTTYKIRSTEPDDFVIPPGEDYGFVAAAGSGIARRAMVDVEEGIKALEQLSSPDTESRTPSYEGRRMVRIDGGFIILNYKLHRDLDYSTERVRKHRDAIKRKALLETVETPLRNDVTGNETQANAGSTTEAISKKKAPKVSALTDEEWIESLKSNPAYKGIDVQREYFKAIAWCSTNNRTATRRMFINWLNRAEQKLGSVKVSGATHPTYRQP